MTSITQYAAQAGPPWEALVVSARWDAARRDAEAGQHLGLAMGRLLWLFSDGETRTLREVTQTLGLEQSTVNRQMNAAMGAGLLLRSRREGVATYLFEASEEGIAQFRADLVRQLGLHRSALDVLPDGERTTFVRHLAAYVQAYGEAARTASPPESETTDG